MREVLAAGAARDALSYRALRTLVALDPAVEQVVGFTRYRIEGDVDADDATIHVVDRGGISLDLRSRTDDDPRLVGTKHRVATQREVTVARGRRDERTVIIVPEVKDNQTVGVTLLQARFVDHLPADVARTVLQGYQGRYGALRDAVTETDADVRRQPPGRRSTWSTCSPSRSTSSPIAGADVGTSAGRSGHERSRTSARR